jgi:hypothetical protein
MSNKQVADGKSVAAVQGRSAEGGLAIKPTGVCIWGEALRMDIWAEKCHFLFFLETFDHLD